MRITPVNSAGGRSAKKLISVTSSNERTSATRPETNAVRPTTWLASSQETCGRASSDPIGGSSAAAFVAHSIGHSSIGNVTFIVVILYACPVQHVLC